MNFEPLPYLTSPAAYSPMAHQRAILQDFREARQQAALQEVLARLTGKSDQLLSFEDVTRRLRLAGRAERGVREIPLAAIVGSVGRYADFTRTFLPRQDSDQARWARVKAAFSGPDRASLPPIDVYQVGQVYFVLDGNHRVSVARQAGLTHIEAHVTEVPTRVPLTPDIEPEDLIVKAEYADFLDQTGLKDRRGLFDLSLTAPGGYEKLRGHVEVCRYALEQEHQRQVTYPEAVQAWYTEVYVPTVLAMRERGLLRWFPGRTETDLYLWVTEHRHALEEELGWAIRPEAAITDLAVKESARAEAQETTPGSWRKAKIVDRYADRLFVDILVPLNGAPECWPVLEQAIVLAQREEARLCGLHLVASEAQRYGPTAEALRMRFKQRCEAAGVMGDLVVETGDVTPKICERALLTDVVVLNAANPPAMGLASLSSGLRAILWKCARPVLAVPGEAARLDRALLTYDGSPKSKEALFVAAYLAERWKTSLLVLALMDGARVPTSVLDYPRAYLESHEVQADFVMATGSVEVFLKTAEERQVDLVLMGGYSVSALEEVMGGSAVNFMLREAHCPLFICR